MIRLLSPIDPFDPGSINFRAAKIAAMLLVVIGHFYNGWWWIPVLFGLWVFAFSSGFFSAVHYKPGCGYWNYLLPKLTRLLIPLLTAQVVVIVSCIWHGRSLNLNLDNLFALIGLTRLADWIGIERLGPLGNGLWFLNLLWFFYLLLPLLWKLLCQRWVNWLICGVGFASAAFLENSCWQGVFFFSTAFAFLFGAAVGSRRLWFTSSGLVIAVVIGIGLILSIATLGGLKMMNAIWLMPASLPVYHVLLRARLPLAKASRLLKKCDAMLLPVYVIHTYLFIGHNAENALAKCGFFILSLLLILLVAMVLARINSRLRA